MLEVYSGVDRVGKYIAQNVRRLSIKDEELL